jgi:hypothetical protein
MDQFKEALKEAADKAVEASRSSADHALRQAFFAGVEFYMHYQRKKPTEPQSPS